MISYEFLKLRLSIFKGVILIKTILIHPLTLSLNLNRMAPKPELGHMALRFKLRPCDTEVKPRLGSICVTWPSLKLNSLSHLH